MQCVYSAKFDSENRRLILDINDQKTTNQQYYSSNFDTSKWIRLSILAALIHPQKNIKLEN